MGNIEVRPTSPSLSDNDSNADNDATASSSEVVPSSARVNNDCDDDGGDGDDDDDDDDDDDEDDVVQSEIENRTNVPNRTNRQQRRTSGRRKDVVRRNRQTVAANEDGRGDTEQPLWSVVVDDHAGGSSQAAAGRRARTSRPLQVRERSRSPCTRLSCSRTHHRNPSRVSRRSRRWSPDPAEPVVMIAAEEQVVVAKPQPRPRRSKRTTAGQLRRS
ncbi:cation channel sperm-associated protein 2-like [Metopolophium dirhodum]|uniref:cation channel sperm-associated protein 2-like n=1 Tax=Metopolophium dirhodum TaxID=44670 RepID=UPI0029901C3E|nr:cation channel sperm-associated protein 2-like [Metopolophium dirhodum]